MRLGDLLAQTAATLSAAEVKSPQAEARLIVAHAADCDLAWLDLHALLGDETTDAVVATAHALTSQRAGGQPLQHVLGQADFRGHTLAVGPGVFVPRPETELLVQLVLEHLSAVSAPDAPVRVYEACTGSAAIALSVALEHPGAQVRTVERDPQALAWAERNISALAHLEPKSRVTLIAGDALADLRDQAGEQWSVIVSNPPYVPLAQPLVDSDAQHDPAIALFSGDDGLDFIRAVAAPARAAIASEGLLALEHGEQQGEAVAGILRAAGWHSVRTHRDLTGRVRFTTARPSAD